MLLETLLVSSSFLLSILLVALLAVLLTNEQKQKPRAKVSDDIKKIKDQISNQQT